MARHYLVLLFAMPLIATAYTNGAKPRMPDLYKNTPVPASPEAAAGTTSHVCPFEYLLDVYKPKQFDRFITHLSPAISSTDREIGNEIMDTFHTSFILADDIFDGSLERKSEPAAHLIFGEHPTMMRAYTRLFDVINKVTTSCPTNLVGYTVEAFAECHQAQDRALFWRKACYYPKVDEYMDKICDPKTGSLFRLAGRVALHNGAADDEMTKLGVYAQLQNDYKNLWGINAYTTKWAEDIDNGMLIRYTYMDRVWSLLICFPAHTRTYYPLSRYNRRNYLSNRVRVGER